MEPNVNHHNYYLSIGSLGVSVCAFIAEHITRNDVAFYGGLIALGFSIYCSVLTIREKKMNMREKKISIKLLEDKLKNTQQQTQ